MTAKSVENLDGIPELIHDMIFRMRYHHGIGLSAPQVGISRRVIIGHFYPSIILNPEIVWSDGEELSEEGCLSLPGEIRNIKRWSKIKVIGLTYTAQPFMLVYDELQAKIIQHEIDHLNGKLIIDY